jgi:hypothetical protein
MQIDLSLRDPKIGLSTSAAMRSGIRPSRPSSHLAAHGSPPKRAAGEALWPKDRHLLVVPSGEWQVPTVQLDFRCRSALTSPIWGKMASTIGGHDPSAILGSIERFFGILIEHYADAFPCGWRCRPAS